MSARRRLALDTGPAIYLDHLGYVRLLSDRFQLLISTAVACELRRRPGAPGSGVPDLEQVKIEEAPASAVEAMRRDAPLHQGEIETLALASDLGIVAVLDERAARQYAGSRGVAVKGTVGIVVDLHTAGLTRNPIEQDIRRLRAAGMYLRDDLAAWAIQRSRGDLPSASRRSAFSRGRERHRRRLPPGSDRWLEA